MSVLNDLKKQISDKRITFDPPPEKATRLQDELLGADKDKKVTERLQSLVLAVSKLEKIRISSIVRNEGHHGTGRAFDVGNEDIAGSLLPSIATSAKVKELGIDEIIFDAGGANLTERNKWNFDAGKKHSYDDATLKKHADHIHFAVVA
jgi:hypothetical protein